MATTQFIPYSTETFKRTFTLREIRSAFDLGTESNVIAKAADAGMDIGPGSEMTYREGVKLRDAVKSDAENARFRQSGGMDKAAAFLDGIVCRETKVMESSDMPKHQGNRRQTPGQANVRRKFEAGIQQGKVTEKNKDRPFASSDQAEAHEGLASGLKAAGPKNRWKKPSRSAKSNYVSEEQSEFQDGMENGIGRTRVRKGGDTGTLNTNLDHPGITVKPGKHVGKATPVQKEIQNSMESGLDVGSERHRRRTKQKGGKKGGGSRKVNIRM